MTRQIPSNERMKEEEESNDASIQSYLKIFNEEIAENYSTMQNVQKSELVVLDIADGANDIRLEDIEQSGNDAGDGGNPNGNCSVDKQGRYYFSDARQILTSMNKVIMSDNEIFMTDDTMNDISVKTLESNQTVQIVQSEVNGKVSYVFIVDRPDDKFKIETNNNESDSLTVYNFNEDVSDNNRNEIKSTTVQKKLYECGFCSYQTVKKYLLKRHMQTHSSEKPHKCSICAKGFKTVTSLRNHLNIHSGTKPHKCRFCASAFTTSGEVIRHVRYRHTHEKPHKCDICNYTSVELSKLNRHKRCHTGERLYQCSHCTYASSDGFKLKRHLRTHTGEKPYECEFCHTCFTQSNSLKTHKLTHNVSAKPVFQCDLCLSTYGRKSDLRTHMEKMHNGNEPWNCKKCGKSLPDKYTFIMHNKTHKGEKHFKCQLCPYSSKVMNRLKTHMFIHTDEKPYSCDKCDQTFRQKQLLKRHQNVYHNPEYVSPSPKEKSHKCMQCKKHFQYKGNLMRHMTVHDPESQGTYVEYDDGKSDNDDEIDTDYTVYEVIQVPEENTEHENKYEDDEKSRAESSRKSSRKIEMADIDNYFAFDENETGDDYINDKTEFD